MAIAIFAGWLIDRGFSYLSSSFVTHANEDAVTGFPSPFSAPLAAIRQLSGLPGFRARPSVRGPGQIHVDPDQSWTPSAITASCALIVHVVQVPGNGLHIGIGDSMALTAALNPRELGKLSSPEHEAATLAFLQRTAAIQINFNDVGELDDTASRFLRFIVDEGVSKAELEAYIASTAVALQPTPRAIFPVPERSQRVLHPRLTVGMACYDDFDGAYFTIQAMRMYHPEVLDDIEFVLIDNHPDGIAGRALKAIEDKAPNYRYIPVKDVVGTAVKDFIFQEAAGDYVMSVDCHVMLVAGALKGLLAYFDAHPDTNDLIQGPILWDQLKGVSSHWEPRWQGGMFGVWANDPAADDPAGPPFAIPMQGTGLFACRRAAWPGFNPKFRGFGGEEWYIHEKFRLRGGRTLCLPALRWLHRFDRPAGVPYPIVWEDRFRNYIIGRIELGQPYDDVIEHMKNHVSESAANNLLKRLRAEEEI